MSRTVQWGLRLDCAKQGCTPPHEDDGLVAGQQREPHTAAWSVNGHATTIVRRVITYSPWVEATPEGQEGAGESGR